MVSSSEFTEWVAFEKTNPSGEERADIRNALLCYTIVSAVGGGKGAKLEDFIIDFEKDDNNKGDMVNQKLEAFIMQHNATTKQ